MDALPRIACRQIVKTNDRRNDAKDPCDSYENCGDAARMRGLRC
jgi:hypothetical protein